MSKDTEAPDLEEIKRSPVAFAKAMGVTLDPWQIEMLETMKNNKVVIPPKSFGDLSAGEQALTSCDMSRALRALSQVDLCDASRRTAAYIAADISQRLIARLDHSAYTAELRRRELVAKGALPHGNARGDRLPDSEMGRRMD